MHAGLRRLMRGTAAMTAALVISAHAHAAGVLRSATLSEPPPLDVMLTTAEVATTIGIHIYETLYASDSRNEAQPLLAAGERVEDGGKTLVIALRQGVPFHIGKEMTADDVVASLKRWG